MELKKHNYPSLADGVRKAVSKANADLAVARAEEHMTEMKTLEESI